MTSLKDLLLQHHAESGIGKLIVQQQIRTYAEMQSVKSLLKEIESVWEKHDLDILIGAGMRGIYYYKCMEQMTKIMGIE